MVAIPLGISDYVRDAAQNWPIFLENMYLERDPANKVDSLARLQRPGLTRFLTETGDGYARGLYRHEGVFNGDWLPVLGDTLYRVTAAGAATTLGSISGTDPVIIAASETRALIATGGTCFSTDGAAVTAIAMPAGEAITSVAFINGYFILTQKDSHRFFWIAPGETNPDPFSFASVENSPGAIQCVVRLQDELWFFKQASLEVWHATGNLDAPFVRIDGRLFERGNANRFTVAVLDNTVFWVGDDLIVYRASAGPQRISDHAIEERLRQAGTAVLSAWVFALDGHTFYCLRIEGEGTFVYDVENTNWPHWHNYLVPLWRARCGTQAGNTVIAGDDQTRTLWRLDTSNNTDDGVAMERIVYGIAPLVGEPQTCDCVRVVCSTGRTLDPEAEPVMELNFSDGQAGVFEGPWYPMSLGRKGDFSIITEVRQLGLITPPGRMFALRCTDDVPFRISYARLNED